MSRPLLIDSLGATIVVFLLCWVLKKVVFNIGFMDPVHSAMHHVEQEFDRHVHGLTRSSAGLSPSICLINIGDADRPRIAQILNTVARYQPRVVGVDILFDRKNAPVDTSLRLALSRLNAQTKLVMVSSLSITGHKGHEHIDQHLSDAPYRFGPAGYTNFVSDEVVQHHMPTMTLPEGKSGSGDEILSFAAQVIATGMPTAWERYQTRHAGIWTHTSERILYQADTSSFIYFTENEVFTNRNRLDSLRGKIVLLGSMTDCDDWHKVPLGDDVRLSGLAIHAHIVALMLGGVYPRHVPHWLLWGLSFLLCWGLMTFFAWRFHDYHTSFHLVFKTVQFLTAALIVLVALLLFRSARLEVDTLPLLVPIALAVDVLYFYEPFAKWLSKKRFAKRLHYKTYFTDTHAH
ncbi:CHASE2 domain-containing protein [Spirosoma areae]